MVVDRLQQMKAAKPRTVKTLSSSIAFLFQQQLAEQDVAILVQELKAKGMVVVNGSKVTYALPHSD